jgi:signal peptidase I
MKEGRFKKIRDYIKRFFRQFWSLLWKDDSFRGWLFSIIFLFVFIKFILFPVLSLVTGSSLPLAIVESCSMYHDGNIFSDYADWWQGHETKYENINVNKSEFDTFRFKNGLNKGDILFIIGIKPEKLKLGDIIIFNAGTQNPVIHRIIKIERKVDGQGNLGVLTFSTMGDNNNGQLSAEISIPENKLIGKTAIRVVPYLGWVKLIFFEHLKPESERGLCHEN